MIGVASEHLRQLKAVGRQGVSMLERSKKSAVVMTAIALVPPCAVLFFGASARAASRQGMQLDILTGIAIFLVVEFIVIILISRWMYGIFKAGYYYGSGGVFRWSIFGLLVATLWTIGFVVLADPRSVDYLAGYLSASLLDFVYRVGSVLISYWVVFRLIRRIDDSSPD